MRQSWTDERLDDFKAETVRRFDHVDAELRALNGRMDAMQGAMIHGTIALTSAMIAGFAAMIILIATQL